MSALLILGAGGHGKVVADAAMSSGWTNIAFLDDRLSADGPLGLPIIGAFADLESIASEFAAAIVAIGDSRQRLALLRSCQSYGLKAASIIHPTAFLSKFSSVAEGCVLLAQSAVNAGAKLGTACIINTGATVDHDCVLGDAVHVCPGAHLAGNVSVGDCAWIGIGAVIRQGITIGRDATIGAGAAVVSEVFDGATVAGVPAKPKPKSK